MAVVKDARPMRTGKKRARYSHKCVLHKRVTEKRLRKEMAKLREKLNLMKELQEKDKAMVEEKKKECAQRRKWNDLALKGDACIRRGINITLDIIGAQDDCDVVRANELQQYLWELVSEHIEEQVALLPGGQE